MGQDNLNKAIENIYRSSSFESPNTRRISNVIDPSNVFESIRGVLIEMPILLIPNGLESYKEYLSNIDNPVYLKWPIFIVNPVVLDNGFLAYFLESSPSSKLYENESAIFPFEFRMMDKSGRSAEKILILNPFPETDITKFIPDESLWELIDSQTNILRQT